MISVNSFVGWVGSAAWSLTGRRCCSRKMINISSFLRPSTFLLTGIPWMESGNMWLAVPFCCMYVISILGNSAILFVIKAECSFHEPNVLLSVHAGYRSAWCISVYAPHSVERASLIHWRSGLMPALPRCSSFTASPPWMFLGEHLKALNTCVCHICAVLIYYIPMIGISMVYRSGKPASPLIHVLMANIYLLVPPVLNSIIYSVKTKQIRRGIHKPLIPRRCWCRTQKTQDVLHIVEQLVNNGLDALYSILSSIWLLRILNL